jgi:NTP pyrophosphatase (non-canonical NTP hydrolase)
MQEEVFESFLTFVDYQKQAKETSGGHKKLDEFESRLAIAALGIAGEAGEVADYIKKVVGHGHEMDRKKLTKEVGDVLWYAAEICSILGVSMGSVARQNINKLNERYPGGFSSEKSINRVG